MPRTFRLNKLVRDGVYSQMIKSGQKVKYKIVATDEEQQKLSDKVIEELNEFDKSNELGELADAYQALKDKAVAAGVNFEDIQIAQEQKLSKLGGFKGKIYVQTVILADDDPWVEYYAADPDRFPEVAE